MFKHKLAFASLLVLSACGTSPDAKQALESMRILQDNSQPGLSYKTTSGWGNDITLHDVEVKAPAFVAAMVSGEDDNPGEDAEGEDAEGEDDVEVSMPDPDAPPVAIARAKSMTLRGLTMKDGKPTVRDIVVSDIAPTSPVEGSTLTFGAIMLEGMNEATGAFIASAFAGEGPTSPPPPLDAWAFSKAGISGIKVGGVIPQDEGSAGSFNIELGELSFSDVSAGKLGLAKLGGLKGDINMPLMPPVVGTFDLGTLTVSGIQVGKLGEQVMAGVQAEVGGEPTDFVELYRDYTSPLEAYVERIDWTGMKVDMSGARLDATEMHAYVTRNADGVVVASDAPRFAVKFTADAGGGSLGALGLMALAMAGYESNTVELYAAAGATFDPAKDLTRWVDYNVGVTDLFDVKMSGGIIGLKQALPNLMNGLMQVASMAAADGEADGEEHDHGDELDEESDVPEVDGDEPDVDDAPDADAEDEDADEDGDEEDQDGDMFGGASPEMVMSLMMGVLPLQLTDLDISITDKNLAKLILGRQALEAGQSLEAYRADLVNMISASSVFLTDVGIDAGIASELTTAAAAFMAGPGTLRIQIRPKTPLGVMSAMAMPLTKESLGFSATFTPAAN